MDISIIIINYNTFELTSQCIRSIYQHTEGIDYEIIVVDNASVECNPDTFLVEFPAIKLLKSEINRGFAGGNNLGIKEARGAYILLLNSDTYLVENSITKSLRKYKTLSSVAALSCKLLSPDGRYQHNCFNFTTWYRFLLEKFRVKKLMPQWLRSKIFLGFDFAYDRSTYCDGVWGTFFLFQKSILQNFQSNLLPENFFMYYEEIDWCMSFKKMGLLSYYYNDTYIYHIGGGSTKGEVSYNAKESYLKLARVHNNTMDYIVFNIFMS